MIGISLTDDGVELLGQRRGLDAYLSAGKTMGHPDPVPVGESAEHQHHTGLTANSSTSRPARAGVRTDDNGLPIHGVLAAAPGWRVTAQSADELVAELDFGAHPELLASFPFPHLLEVAVTLRRPHPDGAHRRRATTDKAVPLCFGFHPYLQLPGVPRRQWTVETPALRHLAVDDRGLPTGASTRAAGRLTNVGRQGVR